MGGELWRDAPCPECNGSAAVYCCEGHCCEGHCCEGHCCEGHDAADFAAPSAFSLSGRLMPPDWRALYRLPPGEWRLAPAELNFAEAEAWAKAQECFDLSCGLSSGDTACRLAKRGDVE